MAAKVRTDVDEPYHTMCMDMVTPHGHDITAYVHTHISVACFLGY